jgi:hypothetical protein
MEKDSKESKEDGEEIVQSVAEAENATWNKLVQIPSFLSTLFHQSPKGPLTQEVIEFNVPIPTNKVFLVLEELTEPFFKLKPPPYQKRPAIFFYNGTFCPIHEGHVHAMEHAKKHLESQHVKLYFLCFNVLTNM